MAGRFHIETLGCPKNQVDSDKLAGTLVADGFDPAAGPGDAVLVVVNTCAFIEDARQESIDTVLAPTSPAGWSMPSRSKPGEGTSAAEKHRGY